MARAKRKNRFLRFRNRCLEYIEANGPATSRKLIGEINVTLKPHSRTLAQLLKRDDRFASRTVNRVDGLGKMAGVLEWYIK